LYSGISWLKKVGSHSYITTFYTQHGEKRIFIYLSAHRTISKDDSITSTSVTLFEVDMPHKHGSGQPSGVETQHTLEH